MAKAKVADNSKNTAKPRKGTPASFKKGQSGNPGGRPRKTPEEFDLIAACKAKAPDALGVLMRIMNSGENERNQLSAAMGIIERGFGKPLQQLEHSGDANNPLQVIQRIELIAPANNS